ncbi:AzlC family ABC transporter permease [Protaetiibacter mangrovi]|uniref:AzlC family ABC transporter permease n=1 Tax=Protaetiibacter mangrovi TaxID=2970926 RepID=A0ABT1ZIJ2_9MICO|nr:AzlC family ABC transporter permease [Protaetiibacter mangrovi]MCS0500531.1 AzlC family ABC transporter permease [Protaetiibacter mangrovi]
MSTAPPTDRERTRSAVLQGIRDAVMIVLGYIPFGLAAGAAMAQTDVGPAVSIASSPIVFAGAAQLVAIQLLDSGAGIALVVATVLIVNARHLLYSASLEPHLAGWTRGQRMAGAFLLADPVYALAITRFERAEGAGSRAEQLGYYFAAGLTCLVGWTGLTTLGVFLGGFIPGWVPLELAIPLTFLLLVLPLIKDSAGLVAAAVGGLAAFLAHGLPFGMGLLVGALVGLIAGGVVLARTAPRDPDAAPDARAEVGHG